MSTVPRTDAPRITQQRADGATILRPAGTLDEDLADELRVLSLEAHSPVVIDLGGGGVRVEADGLQKLVGAWELYRPEMCLVESEPGDLRVLDTIDLRDPVPVFASVDHALAGLAGGRRWSVESAAPAADADGYSRSSEATMPGSSTHG